MPASATKSPAPEPEPIASTLAEQPFFGVYLLQDGRFVFVNERFAQNLGYSVDEVLALPSVLDTVYEADRALVGENIRTRLDGEVEQIRYSLRGRRKDGSPIELEVMGRRVLHDGRPAVLGVQCDVSERAREERTYHAKQKAEALGAMAAGVAHDFRNVLAAIDATAVVMSAGLAGTAANDLAEIRKAAEKGSQLCQQLMSFGAGPKTEGGLASVTAVLASAAPILERLLAPRRIGLSMSLADELPRVRVTPVELEQVIMNLVLNAADASAERAGVELSASVADSAVVLEVRDRGAGIAPEHLERIFEAYFTTKGDKGNGLGLRNVWQIVTGAGGRVEVKSNVGEGSTFSVFLPVDASQPQE